MILLTKFMYYDNLNLDPDTGEGEEIDDAISITVDLGSEMGNNSMRIKMKNDPIDVFSDGTLRHRWVGEDAQPVFKAVKTSRAAVIDEELIKIYAHHESLDPTLDVESTDYLLFIGVINKGKIPFKDTSNAVELTCRDRTIILLDKLTIPQAYKPVDTEAPDGVGWRSPFVIQRMIRQASASDNPAPKFSDTGVSSLQGKYLVDARLFSDGVVDSGTTTSADTRKLIETGQDFTATVDKGDMVRNTTDDTYAYVESVDSNTQLTLSKDIMASGEGYQISDGFIQDSRSNGTAFPVISFSQINKPIKEGVGEMSTTEKTNSPTELSGTMIMKRSMRWFIDTQNRFHWYYPSDTPEWVLEIGQTDAVSPDESYHRIYDISPETFVDDNINFIIFKAGEDMEDVQIKGKKRASFSGAPNVKDSFRDWSTSIARAMKVADAQEGNIVKSTSDTYAYPGSYNPLPSGDDYPAWDEIKSSIPTTDAEYNTAFIAQARKTAEGKAKAIFAKVAFPRWKGQVQIRGEPIGVGDLIDLTSVAHGINNILVRVKQVTHSINAKTGWITTIRFEEDEEEVENI